MNREDLKEQGLSKEQIDYVMKENGKDIEAMKDLEVENGNLNEQLKEANSTIKDFKDLDVDEIQEAADDYKQKFEQAQEEAKKQVEQLKFDHKLESVLGEHKARNTKAVKALLDTESMKLDGDEIKGLEDQLKEIKEANDFLFEPEKPEPSETRIPRFMAPSEKGDSRSSGLVDIGSLANDASIRK